MLIQDYVDFAKYILNTDYIRDKDIDYSKLHCKRYINNYEPISTGANEYTTTKYIFDKILKIAMNNVIKLVINYRGKIDEIETQDKF